MHCVSELCFVDVFFLPQNHWMFEKVIIFHNDPVHSALWASWFLKSFSCKNHLDIITGLALFLLIRTSDISVLPDNCNLTGDETSGQAGLKLPKWPIWFCGAVNLLLKQNERFCSCVHTYTSIFKVCVCASFCFCAVIVCVCESFFCDFILSIIRVWTRSLYSLYCVSCTHTHSILWSRPALMIARSSIYN